MTERLCVYLVNPQDPSELYGIVQDVLDKKVMHNGIPRLGPLENTLDHVLSLNAKCVLLQLDVLDPDFRAEHATYYSRWALDIPKYCKRLHFFNEPPLSSDPLELIDQMASIPEAYLGFLTLRPISMSPVGATILRPPNVESMSFVISLDKFRVNLAGQVFHVIGTPFMQQDNAVGACAQTSIWMALRTLRRREGRAALSPAEITTAATRFLVRGRTLPNRGGLGVEQVAEAVRAAGYSPHVIPLKSEAEKGNSYAKKALYTYVESGIPVLVALIPGKNEGHAVVVLGHGWKVTANELICLDSLVRGSEKEPINIYDASSWVEPFLMHNDNTGPYQQLPENSGAHYLLDHAEFAIPFLPSDVFLDGNEAREVSVKLLRNILSEYHQNETITCAHLVVRTYLQDKAEFRSQVLESHMPEDVKIYYRKKWLPRRVWITEVNVFDGYNQAPSGEACRVAEILVDPASEPEDGAFLSMHLCSVLLPKIYQGQGVIIDRDAFNGDLKALPVSDKQYSPLVRKNS